jgi:hypothetical protein
MMTHQMTTRKAARSKQNKRSTTTTTMSKQQARDLGGVGKPQAAVVDDVCWWVIRVVVD